MEMLLYTKKNLEILNQLQKSFHNDFELGREVRKLFGDSTFIRSLPNDGELGKEIRKVLKNYQK